VRAAPLHSVSTALDQLDSLKTPCRYVSSVPAMSDSRNHPSLPTSEAGIELYHYYRDPAMASAQYNEGYETRSSILNSPDIHGLDAARPASFSFRSSVSLIPTPGAVSTRHPTYVCHRLPMKFHERSLIHGLRRNRSYCAFGL
jgi:hypothetical protein